MLVKRWLNFWYCITIPLQTKKKAGRPKGSGNKDKTAIELSKYLIFIQNAIKLVLGLIKAHYHGMKYANEVFKLLPLGLFIHLTWWLDG